MHLVILVGADVPTREEVHQQIKQHARGWWHHFPDVWFAGGMSVTEWRDLIGEVLPKGVELLVIRLPDTQRSWAYRGQRLRKVTEWLHETYTKKPAPWKEEG